MRSNEQIMDISFFGEDLLERRGGYDEGALGPWLEGQHRTIEQPHKIMENRRYLLQRRPVKKSKDVKLPQLIPKQVYFTPLTTSKDRYLGYRTRRIQQQQERSNSLAYRSLDQRRRSSLPPELESLRALNKKQKKNSFRIIGLPTTTLIHL